MAIHTTVIASLWQINPRPSATPFPEPTVEELLAEAERRMVWYTPEQALPAVAPVEPDTATPDENTPRYESPQRMTANAPDPQSERQMIVSDEPAIEIQQDLDLPNMLSWKAPEVQRPRFQLENPKLTLPADLQVAAEAAPQVNAQAAAAELPLEQMTALERLRYQVQEQQRQADVRRQQVEATAAPTVDTARPSQTALDPRGVDTLARLRYQNGPGAARKTEGPRETAVNAGEAPTISSRQASQAGVAIPREEMGVLARLRYRLGGGTPQREAPQQVRLGVDEAAPAAPGGRPGGSGAPVVGAQGGVDELARIRYRGPNGQTQTGGQAQAARATRAAAEAAPSVGGTSGGNGSGAAAEQLAKMNLPEPSLGAPGGDQSGGNSGDRNLVVAGVNPSNKVPDEFPRGSRRGKFSAGPDGGKGDGGNPGGVETASLRVPNLAIEGPRQGAATPTRGGAGLRSDLDRLLGRGNLEDAVPPANMEIEYDPRKIDLENPFIGRPVYKTAINMPNVTSYRGDWVIQFALLEEEPEDGPDEDIRERVSERPDGVTPPYPVKKVDPKYVADAVRERIEGEVVVYGVIRENGRMTNMTLVKSVDDLLDDTAREALAQWVFEPARVEGKPVAIEALVTIPFHLDPSVKIRY